MQFREFLELNDGTRIMFSKLKYSGVYFLCETSQYGKKRCVKRAMTVWPSDLEPLRFWNIKGYSAGELELLRVHIHKVGNLVLSWAIEELEEELKKESESLSAGNVLLVFDKQQAYSFVAGFINVDGKIQKLVPVTNVGEDYDTLSLYDKDDKMVVKMRVTRDTVMVQPGLEGISYCMKNNGEQRLEFMFSMRRYLVEPGGRVVLL